MHTEVSPRQLRAFGLLVGGIFTLIGLWPLLWQQAMPRWWAVIVAGLLLLPALVAPRCLAVVHRRWMHLGEVLGWINTRIMLSVVFYGLFTPLGLIMRALGREPMPRHFDATAETYRVERQPRPRSHMTHQF